LPYIRTGFSRESQGAYQQLWTDAQSFGGTLV
jgi:hypothetical protein